MARMHGLRIDENKTIIGTVENTPGYRCDECKKELSSRHFLRMHRLNTHGIRDDEDSILDGSPDDIDGRSADSFSSSGGK